MSDNTEKTIVKLGFIVEGGKTFNEINRAEITLRDTGELDSETGTRILKAKTSDLVEILSGALAGAPTEADSETTR